MFVRLLVVLVLAVTMWATFAHSSDASGPERHYRVQPGDTLWTIATEHFAGDPREGVYELQERNRLDGATIVPGQTLVLP